MKMTSLNIKKAEFTKKLLLDAACELAQTLEISDLSFKVVSKKADISQRTMFRYFSTREEFLNELTVRLYSDLNLPEFPSSISELLVYTKSLYEKLEEQPRKVLLLLSADLLPKILETSAKTKHELLKKLLSKHFHNSSKSDIEKTAANFRYLMSASSWRYYRFSFGFDLPTSIECASMVIEQGLEYLQKQEK